MFKKQILIFSNPFGNGPAGKAISIAKYFLSHLDSRQVSVVLCGNNEFKQLAGSDFRFILLDERDEDEISKVLKSLPGEKYVISSQNRFAIRAAHALSIPTAFLDGLAWFWKTVPEEHYLADNIFWLNYPKIAEKIPLEHKEKINVIHGITSESSVLNKNTKSDEVLLYIGGCKNPLSSAPKHYLDLFNLLVTKLPSNFSGLRISTDQDSYDYLNINPAVTKFLTKLNHEDFVKTLACTKKFITNGGQTATVEALQADAAVFFYLPMNLSQYALISKFNLKNRLDWSNYVKIPHNIFDYNEKEAMSLFNQLSLELLSDTQLCNKLYEDFFNLLTSQFTYPMTDNPLGNIGYTGASDMYKILKKPGLY